jgi:HK97 family phage portal protein
MAFWDRWFRRQPTEQKQAASGDVLSVGGLYDRETVPNMALADNQLKLYQALVWVHISVSHVARTFAGTPFEVIRLDGEEEIEEINHPFERLLWNPNPMQSRFALLEAHAAMMRLSGNAYWYLNCSSPTAPPTEITVLPSNRIEVIPGKKMGEIDHYEWDVGDGKKNIIPPWRMMHVKAHHPRNLYVGLSPIESFAKEAETDSKAATFLLNFYGRDNAKPDGALWVNNIDDSLYNRLRELLKRRHGGTRREMLLMRGKADTDFGWLQMGLSQADMEFLASRSFTKEMIYDIFAPGLAAMLAIQSTEATARTGKAVFSELAIHPEHMRLAEQITLDILPRYGDNLRGQFEDVRLSDRAMDLQEQQAAREVMTVDEIRTTYYNLNPLGDWRGGLFAKEIGPQTALLAPGGLGTTPENPTPRQLETGGAMSDEDETAGEVKAADMVIEIEARPTMRDELMQWQRFCINRAKGGKAITPSREFKTESIPPGVKGAIEGALEVATDAEDVAMIFGDVLEAWDNYP